MIFHILWSTRKVILVRGMFAFNECKAVAKEIETNTLHLSL